MTENILFKMMFNKQPRFAFKSIERGGCTTVYNIYFVENQSYTEITIK